MQERQETQGQEDLLEKETATHFSISCLENFMDRGAWWAIVYRVTKSQTRLSEFHIHTYRAHTEQLYMRQFSTAKDAKKKSQ